jgi:3-hydroxybutyryl-CoA dehydrogenase
MVVKKVGVVGCGLMGHGIAQVAAQAGCQVMVREADQPALDKGLGRIKRSLDKLVEKEKLTRSDADAAFGRLSGTLALKDLADCDLVVEAIVENLDVKRALFKELNGLCKPSTIFASNTSS